MTVHPKKISGRNTSSAFTLVEVMVSTMILVMMLAGVFYGYTQANRMAEWSAMSLAAQSYAVQGLERALAAEWERQTPYQSGTGTGDELPPLLGTNTGPVFSETDTNVIPANGVNIIVTNNIYITTNIPNPQVRQIQSSVVWTFPFNKRVYTNSVVTLRALDK